MMTMSRLLRCVSCTQEALRHVTEVTTTRGIHRTTIYQAGGKWRTKHGEHPSGKAYGPLVDIPDWSYADGRPAPLSKGELERREHFSTLGKRAMKAIGEMNTAKEIHKNKLKEQNQIKERQKPRFKSKTSG